MADTSGASKEAEVVPSILTGELEHHRLNLALGRHRRQQFQNRGTNTTSHMGANRCVPPHTSNAGLRR